MQCIHFPQVMARGTIRGNICGDSFALFYDKPLSILRMEHHHAIRAFMGWCSFGSKTHDIGKD